MKEETFQDSREAWEAGRNAATSSSDTHTEWVTGSERRFRPENGEGQTPGQKALPASLEV